MRVWSYPTMTITKISKMVLLTAFKASVFCSGVLISPDTMSIIFPPNFGCSRKNTVSYLRTRCLKTSINNPRERRGTNVKAHTISILEVDAIKSANVAIIIFPASGFACNRKRLGQISSLKDRFSFHQKIPRFIHLQVRVSYKTPHLLPEIFQGLVH